MALVMTSQLTHAISNFVLLKIWPAAIGIADVISNGAGTGLDDEHQLDATLSRPDGPRYDLCRLMT